MLGDEAFGEVVIVIVEDRHGLSPEEQVEEDGEYDAQHETGDNGEMEAPRSAMEGDVAGKPAQKGNLVGEQDRQPTEDHDKAHHDKHDAHLRARFHTASPFIPGCMNLQKKHPISQACRDNHFS